MLRRCLRPLLAVFLLLSLSVAAQAEWLAAEGLVPAAPSVATSEAGAGRTIVEIAVAGLEVDTVIVDGRPHAQLVLPGHVATLDRGEPELPFIATSLIIPGQGTPGLKILAAEFVEFSTLPIVPGRGAILRNVDPRTVPYEFGPAYAGGVYPADLARLDEPYIMRDHRGVTVRLYPAQWDVDRGVLRVLKRVVYEVVTVGDGGVNTLATAPRRVDRPFDGLYRRHFANHDGAAKYSLNDAEGPLLIVSHDDFAAAMQPFIAWKTERGLDVELITTSSAGGTVAGIKDAIQARYDSPAGLAYVVLVGDGAQVPHYSGSYEGADDDTRYVRLAGGDVYPDALISRVSAQSAAAVATQVAKFIRHERDVIAPADWTHMAAGIASNEGSPSDIERAEWLRADLLAHDYTLVDQIYQGQGGGAAVIAAAIDGGRSLANYIGHGSGTSWSSVPFSNTNVHALTNTAWPWIIDVSCLNGGISAIGESFAEAWLRAGTPESPHGAVGMYSSSTNTPWVPPTVMQAEVVDLLCAESSQVLGVLVHGGIMKVLDTYGQTGTGLQLVEQYNLFGDCSLLVRSTTPAELAMDHAPVVPLFAPTFSVTTGAAGVMVTLSGGGVIHGRGTTDAGGHVELILERDVEEVGELTLTAFGFNAATYQATVLAVVPATVAIQPASVPVGEATDVTVTVTDPDTGEGLVGVLVDIAGLGFDAEPAATDELGQVVIAVLPVYGETLRVRGREPGASYDLFVAELPVTGGLPLGEPSIAAGVPDIGLDGALTPHLAGTVTAAVTDEGGFVLLLQGGGLDLAEPVAGLEVALAVTPTELTPITATIARPGHDIFQQAIPVVAAFGTLAGTVVDADDGGVPLAGVGVRGFAAGADPLGEPLFDLLSAADGTFAHGEELPVGHYDLYLSKFGYLARTEALFLAYGANEYQIALVQAPSGAIAGTVAASEDQSPLEATVRVYRGDTGELLQQVETDAATGAYATEPLPFFAYTVDVRSYRRIPQSRTVAVDSTEVTADFLLEPTHGDLLLLDEGGARQTQIAAKLDKHGAVLEPGYLSPADRAAADLAADLEDLGYTVTLQSAAASDPATWPLHDLVILAAGSNTTPLGSSSLRAALTAHRAGGGKLLVEGGEVAYRMSGTDASFLTNVLHVSAWNGDNGGHVTVADPAHRVMSWPNAIAGPINLSYAGFGSADFVTPAPTGHRVGAWSSQATRASVIVYDSNPDPQGGQFVFFTFNYSDLAAARKDLLHNAVEWLITPEHGDCTVSGRARLAGQGQHGGITVAAVPNGGATVTAADGSFQLPDLHAGTYSIVASLDGWASVATEVTLEAGESLAGLDLLLAPVVVAESCAEPAAAIIDHQTTTVTMDLDIDAALADIAVHVDISHTYIGDLRVILRAPGGQEVVLHDRTGASADDIIGWYPGDLAPVGNLQSLVGLPLAGTWSLVVSDHASTDQGRINAWCLRVTYGVEPVTAVDGRPPSVLALEGNHPNPFNPMTVIGFTLPAAREVELAVFDLRGQKVATLVRGVLEAGRHTAVWQGRDDAGAPAASGMYFYRLRAGDQSLVGKMLLVK